MRRTVVILCLVLAGCAGNKAVPIRHFLLEPQLTPQPQPQAVGQGTSPAVLTTADGVDAATGYTLGVRPFVAVKPYSLPMIYLVSEHEVGLSTAEEWAEPPEDGLTRVVADALAETGRFQDVGNAADMARPDFILTGEVRRFLEDRTVTPSVADLEVRLEVREARDVRLIWAATLRAQVPVQADTPNAVAAAMSEAAAIVARDAARAVSTVALAAP